MGFPCRILIDRGVAHLRNIEIRCFRSGDVFFETLGPTMGRVWKLSILLLALWPAGKDVAESRTLLLFAEDGVELCCNIQSFGKWS